MIPLGDYDLLSLADMLNPSKTDEMTMSSEPFDSKDLARKISAGIRCFAGVVSFAPVSLRA
jgi:hypothetical protein